MAGWESQVEKKQENAQIGHQTDAKTDTELIQITNDPTTTAVFWFKRGSANPGCEPILVGYFLDAIKLTMDYPSKHY